MIPAYRHAAYDTPWWVSPSRREGRFHRRKDAPTQYLSLHPLGPAAEMLRHHVGPSASPEEADMLQLDLWVLLVPTTGLIDVDFAWCADRWGIEAEELVGEDYGPCQQLASQVRAEGAAGMVVPSAALPGTDNLVLFGPRVAHPYRWEPVIAEEVQTGHLTDGARTAREVLPLVRWIGDEHSGVRRWRTDGHAPVLEDPPPVRW